MSGTENKFYSFNIDYKYQLQTNWCWAACFQWISEILNFTPKMGKEQHNFVSYYNDNYKNGSWNCNKENPDYNCNIPIEFDDVEGLVEDVFGFECNEIDLVSYSNSAERTSTLNKLLDYDYVKRTLKENNFPIILAVSNHILLVTGYGIKNECKYILVSDPKNNKGESFWVDDNYIGNNILRIKRIWITNNTFSPDKKIVEDSFINFYSQKSIEFNNSIKENIQAPYEDDFSIFFLAQDINQTIINYKDRDSNLLLDHIVHKIKEFDIKTSCSIKIKKKEVDNLELIYNSVRNYLKTGELNIDINDFENHINEYSTRVKLNTIKGGLFLNIIEAPEEFDIINKNIPNDEFHKILEEYNNN
ncbi:hypothetical protein [Aquimarina rubra]|uniref:Peptidase C39-like domain-containing protein n=1 Tax=Aquimarina rubra TaxID=1920033 RepID=A0ABW5LM98_9FLAO